MTVSNTARRVVYNGNGATKSFAVTFGFFELAVYVAGVLMTEGVDYSITQASPGATGTVVFGTAPVSDTGNVAIVGNTDFVQPTDYQDNDAFPADTFELSVDRPVMMARENYDRLLQSIRAPFFEPSLPELSFKNSPATFLYVNESGVPELADIEGADSPFYDTLVDITAKADAAALSEFNAGVSEANAELDADRSEAAQDAAELVASELQALRAPLVLFATGQSNIAYKRDYSWTPAPNLHLWNQDYSTTGTAFVPMPNDKMGTAYAWANEIAKANPYREVYLINVATGSLSISQWLSGTGAPDMYAYGKTQIEAALTVIGVSQIHAMLWWQGEQDGYFPRDSYMDDFDTYHARLRGETWFPFSTPITICAVSPLTNASVINPVLKAVAARESTVRSFVDLTMLPSSAWDPSFNGTNLHCTAAGYEKAGIAAALTGRYSAARSINGETLLDVMTPTAITGTNNDYAPTYVDGCAVIRLSGSSTPLLTGLKACKHGSVRTIANVGAATIQLYNEHASSTAANRFVLGSNLFLQPGQSITVWYDGVSSRWRPLSNGVSLTNVQPAFVTPVGTDTIYGKNAAGGYDQQSTLSSIFAAMGREKLTAARTYYVRTDGSDSNNGLANTSGGAFLTLQKAWDTVVALDQNTYTVTIQVGAGTYTAGITSTTPPFGGSVVVQGDTTTPSNVVISTTSSNCFNLNFKGPVTIKGFKLQTTTSGSGIAAGFGCYVTFVNMDFGACASYHLQASTGAAITNSGNYTISGAAQIHALATTGAQITIASAATVTITGTPAFSGSFVQAQTNSVITSAGVTWSGSATGLRYIGTSGGAFQTFGSGATYFPGGTAGTLTGGAVYDSTVGFGNFRTALTANTTYYVRADGNDSNTGLANTSGGAWLTLQKAADYIQNNVDLAGFTATVQVGAGTYTAGVTAIGYDYTGGIVKFTGDTTTPSNVVISLAAGSCFDLRRGSRMYIEGFKLVSAAEHGIHVSSGSYLGITGKMDYGACSIYHMTADHQSTIGVSGSYNITGGAQAHWNANNNSDIEVTQGSPTITITGTPAFGTNFAGADRGGVIETTATFSGSATGKLFTIGIESWISSTNTLPGNAAGSYTAAAAASLVVGADPTLRPIGGATAALQVQGTTTNTASIGISRWSPDTGPARAILAKSRGASIGSGAIVQSGDPLGEFMVYGDQSTGGSNFINASSIRTTVDGTPGASNDMPAKVDILTTADGSGTLGVGLTVRNNKAIEFPSITTTASAANAYLDSAANNNLLRSTSSLTYKTDVEPVDPAIADAFLEAAEPIWYHSLASADKLDNGEMKSFYSFGAEALAKIDPRLVNWGYQPQHFDTVIDETVEKGPDGQPIVTHTERRVLKDDAVKVPDGVNDRAILAMLVSIVKRQATELEELKRRLN